MSGWNMTLCGGASRRPLEARDELGVSAAGRSREGVPSSPDATDSTAYVLEPLWKFSRVLLRRPEPLAVTSSKMSFGGGSWPWTTFSCSKLKSYAPRHVTAVGQCARNERPGSSAAPSSFFRAGLGPGT